ncbi:hypothetical protein BGX27_002858 [Mortierella sp. AM989]|nr:hypothetical protein BGX27_002858 [Mortierella sp. AM989]
MSALYNLHFGKLRPCPERQWSSSCKIFRDIALSILKDGNLATLQFKTVKDAMDLCSNNGDITKVLQSILALFKDLQAIPILGNDALNKELEELADELSGYIATANSTVITFIDGEFISV